MILLVCVIVALGAYFFTLLGTVFYDAPYIRTPARDIPLIFEAAALKPGEVFYELGSGDGRIVRMAAEQGARAIGIEKSISLIWWSRLRTVILRSKNLSAGRQVSHECAARIHFLHASICDVDLSSANVVFCYLLPGIMPRLKDKFEKELKPGTRVISYAFPIPGWTPTLRLKPTPRKVIHVYVKKDIVTLAR